MTPETINAKPFLLTMAGEGQLRIWEITEYEERRSEPGVWVLSIRDVTNRSGGEMVTTLRSDARESIFAYAASRDLAVVIKSAAEGTWANHERTIANLEKAVQNAKNNQWDDFKNVATLANGI